MEPLILYKNDFAILCLTAKVMKWTTIDTFAYIIKKIFHYLYNYLHHNLLSYEVDTYLSVYNFLILLYVAGVTYKIYKITLHESASIYKYKQDVEYFKLKMVNYEILEELLQELSYDVISTRADVDDLKKKVRTRIINKKESDRSIRNSHRTASKPKGYYKGM